jgi:predicted nuclease of predicted toxin-antitoxin system
MTWIDAHLLYEKDSATRREIAQVIDFAKRKAKARFYADENFPTLATELLRTKVDVVTAQDVGKRRHPDENHAAFALREKRVLVTCDRDYLDERRFPLIHCPAIVVFDFGSGSLREIAQAFRCLRSILRVPQFYDKWAKIDAKPWTWVEYCRYLNGTTSRTRFRYHHRVLQEWTND